MSSLNKVFDKLNGVNKYLYNKDSLTLREKYLYELTAFSMSLIREDKENIVETAISNSIHKAIIEIITLISYLNDNKEFENEVNSYISFKEKEIYDLYKDKIKSPFYHFEKLSSLNESKEINNELFNFDFDMTEYVKKYHDELLSYYSSVLNNEEIQYLSMETVTFMLAYLICKKAYPDIEPKYKETAEYEDSFFLNHPLSQRYLTYVRSEQSLLKRIINYREEFKNISNMLISFSIDKIYLNSEAFEIKFVTFIKYLTDTYNKITNDNVSIYEFIDIVYNDDVKKEYIKLIYDESIILNHKVGYMVDSYIDVYQEYSEAIMFIDSAIGELIKHSGDADIYNDLVNISNAKNTFDYENQYLVDKKEEE